LTQVSASSVRVLADAGAQIAQLPASRYFGWIVGSPPGAPGGGMTFVFPVGGGRIAISGSTPAGGQMIPFDSESLSLRLGTALPTVGGEFVETSGGQAGRAG